MADAKITALPELTSMSDDDLFVVVDNPSGAPTSKKITKANLFSSIPSTDTTYNATSPITIVGTTIAIPKATTSEDGYISSTDWDTLNDNATFRATPSTVITAGANLTWDGNTLNAVSGTAAGSNHADLSNLEYANAGHTGFVSTATLTTHTGSSAIHFLESAIDHTNITNIGTNAHTAIDTHIASASIHFSSVGTTELSATGTASSSTYLRGDNTWGEVSSDGPTSAALNTLVKQSGYNAIRQAQDRAITLNPYGEFTEAYTDATGRLNSVVTASTDANFDTNKYKLLVPTLTNTTPAVPASGGYSNSPTVSLTCSVASDGYLSQYYCDGRSIVSITIKKNGSVVASKTPGTNTVNFTPADYSSIIETGDTMLITVNVSGDWTRYAQAYSGTLFSYTSQYVFRTDHMTYSSYSEATELEVCHEVSSGTFSDTVSDTYGTALIADWDDGSKIQYKLYNSTSDTGWLEIDEYSSFTPFTSEPTKMRVKLLAASTSPTATYPSIYGVNVVE